MSAFLTACGETTSAPGDVSADIEAANSQFMAAFNQGDAAGVAAAYTADAKLYPPNMDMLQGREAIAAFWQAPIDGGISKAELTTVSATGFGDLAHEIGTYKLYAGDQVADQGKYLVIWKKEGGQWKLHEDIWNSSLPVPQPVAEEQTATEGE